MIPYVGEFTGTWEVLCLALNFFPHTWFSVAGLVVRIYLSSYLISTFLIRFLFWTIVVSMSHNTHVMQSKCAIQQPKYNK